MTDYSTRHYKFPPPPTAAGLGAAKRFNDSSITDVGVDAAGVEWVERSSLGHSGDTASGEDRSRVTVAELLREPRLTDSFAREDAASAAWRDSFRR